MQQSEAGRMPGSRRRARRMWRYVAVLAAYILLACVLTWPLIAHLTSHVPGDGRDDPPLVWNLWWVRYALLDLHANPLNTGYLFFPIGANLTFYTLTILNGLLSIPLQLAGSLVLASNLLLLSSYALAGFGMYLLALDVLPAHWRRQGEAAYLAAFLAGLVYAFAPVKMIFASLGQFNMASTQWIPFCVLYMLRLARPSPEPAAAGWLSDLTADRRGRHDALLAAIFLLLQAYAELTFASFLVLFFAGYLAYLALRRRRLLSRRLLGRVLLLGVVFVAGLWPILSSMLHEIRVEGDYSLAAGWGFADIFSADVLGFLTPSDLHPLWGALAQGISSAFSYTNVATSGLLVLLLALVGWWSQRGKSAGLPTAAFWAGAALSFAVLSLGPVLHIAGRSLYTLDGIAFRLPLPFIILHYLPIIKANRYPSRLQVMVVLCLAVLVAYGAAAVLAWARARAETAGAGRQQGGPQPQAITRWAAAGLAAVIIVEYLAVPLPLSDMHVPEVYARMARDNQHATVLDLPLSWRNSFQFIPQSFTQLPLSVNTVTMFQQYYQSSHQGPILSGNTSRNPEFTMTYFLQAPLMRTIVDLEEGRAVGQAQLAYDRSIAPDVLRLLGLNYVVIHPPLVGGPVEDYVRAVFPVEAMAAGDGLSAYRVASPAPDTRFTIDMGSDLSNLYRAEGWGEPQMIAGQAGRWSSRLQPRLMIPLSSDGPVSVTIMLLQDFPGSQPPVVLNGHRVMPSGGMPVGEWTSFTYRFPAGVARAGVNDLLIVNALSRGDLPPPPPVTGKPFAVGRTGAETAANVVAQSAGLEAGGDMGFAHIYVNGRDAVEAGRGLNVAVIEASSGNVTATATFDPLARPADSARLLDFVKSAPQGSLVAVAVMDDAATNFGDAAAEALRLIGAQADLRGKFRWSYAAVGVKGAQPGQALEELRQGRPASVAVGAHVFGDALGVAVSSVDVQQAP